MLRTFYISILVICLVKCDSTTTTRYDGDYNNYNYDDDYDNRNANENFVDYPTVVPFLNRIELRQRTFADQIFYFVFKDSKLNYIANGSSNETFKDLGCNVNDDFTFIIHGWREQADTEWIPELVANFGKYRGGCIVVVDYGVYADGPYLRLVQKYDQITYTIFNKMRSWQPKGLNPSKTHMFGFSFGARLALAIGRRFGPKTIKSIDSCDMAGPGFDYKLNKIDYRDSAQNVQCIHTSRDKGTRHYTNCHQNWRLGNCGFNQPGAGDPPYGSHGMCPYYYNLSFNHNFYAYKKPDVCLARNPAKRWPSHFKMGYTESRKSEVIGELFVPLSPDSPYVLPLKPGRDDENAIMYAVLPFDTAQRFRRFQRRPMVRRLNKMRRNLINRRRRIIRRAVNNLHP